MNPYFQFILGIGLASAVAYLSFKLHALSSNGALTAALLGSIIFGLGGLSWSILLLAFFISSSGLSKLMGKRKQALEEKFSKGSRRDAGQVLANGGIAGIFVVLHLIFPQEQWPWVAFAGSLAAATADTWATELGVLSKATPRLISTGKRVERGTSGGISFLGTLSALGGALLIALLAILLESKSGLNSNQMALSGALIGFSGLIASLVDSLLGATVQAIFYCPVCRKETERSPYHTCNTATQYQRGWKWMDNDAVNTACTVAGSGIAAILFLILL